jgi:HEAT repeat protein
LSTNRTPLSLAIEALRSLHDGDRGVAETIALGKEAIPPLRELLFEREPSGLFETRRRAVEALASLGAYKTLVDFLESSPNIADPVERLGEDAVINAAARALRDLREPCVFRLLISLIERRGALPGVVMALGGFRRAEAIPHLINALAEDESRAEAEAALREVGALAHDSLIVEALPDPTPTDRESESRLRQRRSALALLVQSGIRPREWPALRNIMDDRDPRLALLACRLCLSCAPKSERREAIARLRSLLPGADIPLRLDIEQSLMQDMQQENEN